MTVDAGENVELVCNASARPPATIEWTRLGGALLPIGQEKKLVGVIFSVLHFSYTTTFSSVLID